jgi:predicted  nucleic acid-binding Zn-ribbon protein
VLARLLKHDPRKLRRLCLECDHNRRSRNRKAANSAADAVKDAAAAAAAADNNDADDNDGDNNNPCAMLLGWVMRPAAGTTQIV